MTRQEADARPFIRIEGVTKRFGDFVALNDVSLNIFKGELFCLLGGSGCGKTTLLRLLAGFEEPSGGKIFLDDVDMSGVPPYERPVNMMFQSYALFPHMTVAANIAFGLKQEHMPGAQIETRVAEMLELVKMSEFARRKPHQLSGGQRQRVALARALAKRPKLLLLDEPLAALDKKLREHTQFELVNIQRQLGVTFVVVTHDQEEAMTLATRVGLMDRGVIVQVGTPRDIYEFPSNRFVAEFIGSINVFEGRVLENEAGYSRIACNDLECTVYLDHALQAAVGAAMQVAIRPEKIELTLDRPLSQQNVAHGVVQEVAYTGDSNIYRVKLDSEKIIRATRPNVRRQDERPIERGQSIFVHWHPSSPVIVKQ